MDIYLAASYSRRLELLGYWKQLEAAGHQVVSTWVDGHHEKPGQESVVVDDGSKRFNAPDEDIAIRAVENVRDAARADCIISFTGSGNRGGRHVEFGIGVAFNSRMVVVGPREHVFHYLPQIEVYERWEDCLAALTPTAVTTTANS